MNIRKLDLANFEEFSSQMGRLIAMDEVHYLDLTGQWERFGEWLEWLVDYGEPNWCDPLMSLELLYFGSAEPPYGFEVRCWPPRNIVLLGRASNSVDHDSQVYWLKDYREVNWRTALLITPTEEIDILSIFLSCTECPIEQIIVRPPEHRTLAKQIDRRDLWTPHGSLAAYARYCRDSIIEQVRKIRGKCLFCGLDDSPLRPGSCGTCLGTGLAPGLPRLMVEGDEMFQERLEKTP